MLDKKTVNKIVLEHLNDNHTGGQMIMHVQGETFVVNLPSTSTQFATGTSDRSLPPPISLNVLPEPIELISIICTVQAWRKCSIMHIHMSLLGIINLMVKHCCPRSQIKYAKMMRGVGDADKDLKKNKFDFTYPVYVQKYVRHLRYDDDNLL